MEITEPTSVQDWAEKLLAPVVYLVILMMIGIPGNLTVLIIYGRKYTPSVYKIIIWNLALADLLFCVIGIPFNIARVVHYYTFQGRYVCIIFIVVMMSLILYSVNLIILLSVFRFRKICMPPKYHMTYVNMKYWILTCLVIGVAFAAPQFAIPKIEIIDIGHNATGTTCAISLSHPSIYSMIYTYGCLFLFSLYTVVLILMYSLIGRKIYLQRKNKSKEDNPNTSVENVISSKTTKVAFTISLVFALSYIPVFILQITAKYIKEGELNAFEFSTVRIVERLYVINHVANPFIYAIFDIRFRQHFRLLQILRLWMNPVSSNNKSVRRSNP